MTDMTDMTDISHRPALRLIAPAGPVDPARFRRGVSWLEQYCDVSFDTAVLSRDAYLAGSDTRRLGEIQKALRDPNIDALMCVRGGYGAMRLLSGLPPDFIRQANKPIIGFSDITALHLLWARAGVPSFHASMVGALGGDSDSQTVSVYMASLRQEWLPVLDSIRSGSVHLKPLIGLQPLSRAAHRCEGTLVGGNLSLVSALAESESCPDFVNKVLFLEDIGESAYRVDRLLTSLRLRGVFDEVAGVVFGQFIDCTKSAGRTVQEVLEEEFRDSSSPIFCRAECGHGSLNRPLAFGQRVSLGAGKLRYMCRTER